MPQLSPGTLLPSELEPDARLRSYQTIVDPQLPGAKGKEMHRRYEATPRLPGTDPRQAGTRARNSKRKARKVVDKIEYKFDKYSVGPPPPRELVLSGLSPRTTPSVVLQQCRAFGAVESHELKVDPQTGESIGIMWIQFANGGLPGAAAQDGAEVARTAQKALHQHKIGQETVQAVLDHDRQKYVKLYREFLSKRYSGARRRSLPSRQESPRVPLHVDSPRNRNVQSPGPRTMRRWGRNEDEETDSPHRATTSRAVFASARPERSTDARMTAAPIRQRLAELGNPYIFVPLAKSTLDAKAVRAHFAHFSPALVESDAGGWYIGFADKDTAARCKRVLEPATLHGYQVRLDVQNPPQGEIKTEAPLEAPKKTSWTQEELVDEATKQLLDALQSMFLRDVKNRTLTPLLTQFLRPEGRGGAFLEQYKSGMKEKPSYAPPVLDTHLPSFRKKPEVVAAQRAAKPEVRVEASETERSAPVLLDPMAAGVAEDAEELYYLKEVLARGIPDEDQGPHQSGCARAEGFYRIPAAEKAAHLPDRNRAIAEPTTGRSSLASARNNRADSRRLVLDIEQHKKETMTDTDILKFNQLQSRKKQLRFSKSPIHDWGLYAMELIPAGDMVIEYVGEIVRQQVADHREKMYERAGNFSTYLFRVDDDVVVDATHKGNIARLMNHCCTPNCTAKILTLQGEKRIALLYVSLLTQRKKYHSSGARADVRLQMYVSIPDPVQSSESDEDAIACLCGSPQCRRFL